MGEVLNNLIRFITIIGYFILIFLGVYMGLSAIGTDVMQDSYKKAYQRGDKAASVPFYDIQKNRISYTFIFAAHPKMWLKVMSKVFPPIDDLSQMSKGNYVKPAYLTQERMGWHFAPWLFGSAMLALLFEFLVYPFVRTRVARWLAEDRTQIFGSVKDLPQGDGFVLADDVRLARNGGGNPHVVTVGPTGNGKTTTQVLPSIFQMPEDTSFVCTDPKAEIISRTAPYLTSIGYDVIAIGPLMGYGVGWDPLRDCRNVDECRALAKQILNSKSDTGQTDTWINMTVNLVAAYSIQAWVDGRGLPDAFEALYCDDADGESISDEDASLSYTLFKGSMKSENTTGGILATLQGVISELTMNQVVGFMRHEKRFVFSQLRERKTAVFLISSAADHETIKPIAWLFFTRLFTALAKGGKYDVRIIFDEFANLGKLDNVDQALTLLRSAGVQIHAFIQNLSQIRAVYGGDVGDVVTESFGTVCIMSGLRKDAKSLSELLGLQGVVRASYSTQDEKMRAQYGQNDKSAMDGSLLRQIGKDEVLIISGNIKPVFANLKPWYATPKLLKRCLIKHMQKDWSDITDAQKLAFTKAFPVIEPSRIVVVEKNKPETKPKTKRKKAAAPDEPPVEDLDSWFEQINSEEEEHENKI